MKIKTKLTLGVGLLFILIILLAMVGARYITALKNDTENILVANYNTLEYSRNMLLAIDETETDPDAFVKFESNLLKQENNITEIGERETTGQLAEHFKQWKGNHTNIALQYNMRKDIAELMRLNMEAIQRKSKKATETAAAAINWILITGTLCFLIAFTLLINLPGHIANPIKEISKSIKQISEKNYAQRVHFESHSEFGELARSFNSMAEKLQEYDSSNLSNLLFEKKRIETLINNMHDPVIGLDEKRKILFVNDEALKILGIPEEELIGKLAQDVAITNDLVRSLMQDLISANTVTSSSTAQKSPSIKIFADNKESYFEKEIVTITIIPTGEKERKLIGHVIVLKNITPFKELDFAKTNFIATISHELKTPISAIKMSLQLLENQMTGPINAEQKSLIESISDDSNRLLKITSELLNMSQVETGKIQLSLQKSNPSQIIDYALDAVKKEAEEKQIEIEVIKREPLPQVKADAEKTAWVLVNLLTNAIRYSSGNSRITIEIESDLQQLTFSVKDQGKGIDKRYQEKIFDRYFQIPGSSKSGTGLGLAISKEFIEAQGGSIGLSSEIGLGSTFYFKLNKA